MAQVAHRMTADEYLAESEDSRRSELVEREIVVHGPNSLHQLVVLDLLRVLDGWTTSQAGRGQVFLPLDVKLDDRNVFSPDLLWYAEGRAPERDGRWPYALPNLAVEVRSRSTWRYDIGATRCWPRRQPLLEKRTQPEDLRASLGRRALPATLTRDGPSPVSSRRARRPLPRCSRAVRGVWEGT